MRLHQRLASAYVLVVVLLLTFLFGCRAFEPETVIVNHPPETYVTGAPAEEGGGQFHYHVFWHGTDTDGQVARFVWALTDSTVQDDETDDDEEDVRFNPALNITTLDIGNWTTNTDTIFDFQIGEGPNTSRDMTFHIVAVDDRGDFDRTPARLYFLSNALGNPQIRFYDSLDQTAEHLIAGNDTIGYAKPFALSWAGSTPNIASFTDELLADRDTVPPLDGLYGYKYRLPLDVDCDEVNNDCWLPTQFDLQENAFVSYFGDVTGLEFANDDSGEDAGRRRLFQGLHTLLVNTIDVAGVEIPSEDQVLNFIVNYDPDTALLGLPKDYDGDGVFEDVPTVDPFYDDPTVYPYYTVYSPDGAVTSTAFTAGDTIPHRSVAMFKAIGWDHSGDTPLADFLPPEELPEYNIAFQGKFDCIGRYRGGQDSPFPFSVPYSEVMTSLWDDPAVGVSADTLSFIVGPFEYTYQMRSVDEHGRRDGTPSEFEFVGNLKPTVQCAKAVLPGTPSGYIEDVCNDDVDTFYATYLGAPDPGQPDWQSLGTGVFNNPDAVTYVNPTSGSVVRGFDPGDGYFNMGPMLTYTYEIHIYAEDGDEDRLFLPSTGVGVPSFGEADERLMGLRYEIVSDLDPLNDAPDGNGTDNLRLINFTLDTQTPGAHIDDNGVWIITVELYLPYFYMNSDYEGFISSMMTTHNMLRVDAERTFELLTRQMGTTTATFVARDASTAQVNSDHSAYYTFAGVRAPEGHSEADDYDSDAWLEKWSYEFFFGESAPAAHQYTLRIVTVTGEIFPPLMNAKTTATNGHRQAGR